MNIVVFGASGMVGQGVLRECLLDGRVDRVLVIGRTGVGIQHPELRELIQADPGDLSAVAAELAEYDACFFCLGVSAAGLTEDAYRAITHDLTLAVARPLAEANPELVFCYVSGAGTDSSEQGRAMWARVKGRTENDLLKLPFRAYMFRPGFIQPLHGAVSKTRSYRILYTVLGPALPLLRRLAPNRITSTEQLAQAMLAVATSDPADPADATPHILDPAAINRLAVQPA